MIGDSMAGKAVSVLGCVQDLADFVTLETDDLLLVKFWRRHFSGVIDGNEALVEEILKKGADGRELSRLGSFVAGEFFLAERIAGEIGEEDLDVCIGDPLQILKGDLLGIFVFENFLGEEIEEDAEIVGIIEAGKDTRAILDAAEKVLAVFGELIEQTVNAFEILQIPFLIVVDTLFYHKNIIHENGGCVNFTNS